MLALQDTPQTIFNKTQLLNAAQIREVRDAVEGLRSAWHCRFAGSTFYTLGMSSYLDAATPGTREVYYQGSRIANPHHVAAPGLALPKAAAPLERRPGGAGALSPGLRASRLPHLSRPSHHEVLRSQHSRGCAVLRT